MKKDLWSERELVFRQELKKMRKNAGLSQVDLADKLGKPQSFVSKYESGERQLKFLEIDQVCIACDSDLISFTKAFKSADLIKFTPN